MSLGTDHAAVAATRKLDRTLLQGMLVVALFAAVAGAARVAQDAVIAWRFGTGPQVDAYYFVVNLANWPVAVALSTLTMLVAPADAALRQGAPGAAWRFRAELLAAVLLLALLSLPVAWWALRAIVGSPWGGLEREAAAQAAAGIPALIAAVPLGLIGALLAAWLVAMGRHLLTLLEALTPLVLTAAVLLLPGSVLFWGTAAGVVLQVAAMALVLHLARELPRPRFGLSVQAWRGFSHGALALLAGQMLFALVPLVDPFFAARLGDGAVATLSYANRLVLGLQGLAGLALQRAGLPLLARLTATSPETSRRTAVRWAAAAGAAGLLLGVVVAVLADPLVSLLFERGRFSAADREQVATLLRYGMLQMPPFLAGMVLVTALASARGGSLLALAAGAGVVAKIVLSMVLVPRHGIVGLLLATALMYTITAFLAWAALGRQLRRPRP